VVGEVNFGRDTMLYIFSVVGMKW